MVRLQIKNGFSLVEMSVVLVVIGLITGMGVSAAIDSLESTRRVATETKLDVIESALFNFRKNYGRLPCPADSTLATDNTDYGVEAANMSGTCTGGTPAATHVTPTLAIPDATESGAVPSGALPARTLGLPDEFMYDSWGGKFMYEVTPAMTMENAFSNMQLSDNCAITIKDQADNALPIKPVYALVSHGKNGIGAYSKGGTRQTTGTAGTAEQTNVRATTDTPTVRFKNGVNGARNTAGYYDDIVRFKALYQMMDDIQRNAVPYSGPEMTLAYSAASGAQIVYGKKRCGRYQDFTGTKPAVVVSNPVFTGFTPANTNFFAYYSDGIAGTCNLYSIIGNVLAAVTSATPVPNCPAAATLGVMAQNNGMLVLNGDAAPFMSVYSLLGSAGAASYVELPNALYPALASMPENMSLSENGDYLAVSRHTATAYKNIYVKNGDHYVALTNATQPDNANVVYSNAISPNGKYYASTVISLSGNDTELSVWRNVNGVYTQVGSTLTLAGLAEPSVVSFSPDSAYVAVGGATVDSVYVVNIDSVTETLTVSSVMSFGATPTDIAFSADNNFMGVVLASSGSGAMALYRRTGATTWTADNASNLTFNGSANGKAIAFSR